MMNKRVILIVGGGASGTLLAIQLSRILKNGEKIKIIDDGEESGRGVAYSARLQEHILNVPVGSMSAFASEPDHFLNWLWQFKPKAKKITSGSPLAKISSVTWWFSLLAI